MADIDGILLKLKDIYQVDSGLGPDIPLPLQAQQYAHRASEYIGAASVLEAHGPSHWLATAQLTGQAVELSLKACLASASIAPPRGRDGHDLVNLCKKVQEAGFALSDPDFAAVVHLHHQYFRDLATGTKFKSRYPSGRNERLGGAMPTNSTFSAFVRNLLGQAAQKWTR